MHNHLYLSGIKHSGKTTLAAIIARRLGMAWIDLDDLVEEAIKPHPSIRSFYREEGQQAFQQVEREVLQRLLASATRAMVIALGGGACDNEPLMHSVKGSGTLIYLQVDEKPLIARILEGGIPPFLDSTDPYGSFHLLYTRRHERYSKICDILVELPDGLDAEGAGELVLSHVAQEA